VGPGRTPDLDHRRAGHRLADPDAGYPGRRRRRTTSARGTDQR
jgi:hypothetical protein